VAAQQPARTQRAACQRTVLLQSLQGIGRTTGLKAAAIAKPGFEEQTIALHEANQSLLRGD
jgi:hypothetical protein